LRRFGKQSRNGIAQAGINHASQPLDQVAGRAAVGLDCPAFLNDMMRCPDARLWIDELGIDYPLERHRRTSDDAHLAWINHASAKQPALCIATAGNDGNAWKQT
jgi:hypothetical protein